MSTSEKGWQSSFKPLNKRKITSKIKRKIVLKSFTMTAKAHQQ
jgi:hypothetical protein